MDSLASHPGDGALLVFNAGNTRVAVGHGIPGTPGFRQEFLPTEDFLARWTPPSAEIAWRGVGACVVPAIRDGLRRLCPGRIHWIGPGDYPEIDLCGYPGERLGADRLANVAAAHHLSPDRPVMVLDCGTALNSVCVAADGRFLGGVILPGRETALRSLSRNTAQLPEFAVNAPHELNPLGRSTEDGIRNGVDLGILGAAERIVRATRACADMAGCRVWFTGGDAPFFVKYLPGELGVELAPVPLTLLGVSLAAK